MVEGWPTVSTVIRKRAFSGAPNPILTAIHSNTLCKQTLLIVVSSRASALSPLLIALLPQSTTPH